MEPQRPLLNKRVGWILFAVALLIRLAYLALVHQPPVTFDARKYVAVALAAPLAIANPSLWSDSTARDKMDFHLLYKDLIADEDVTWFPYAFPNYDDALNHLYAIGPVYPAFLGAVFRLTPHWDFWIVRILQAVLDSLTVVLIWILMCRLISAAGGLIAAGLWTIYGPAIYKCGELNTETISILLGVTILWLVIRAHDRRRLGPMIAAGALTGVLTLTKASASALVVLLAIGWLIAQRRQAKWGVLGAIGMVGASALAVAPWMLVIHWKYDVYAMRDPAYAGGNFRQANIVASEGYNLDLAPDDFWTFPVWREMNAHPGDYLLLYLRKFYRTWARGSDEFRRGFPFGQAGTQFMQHLIVLLALFGLFLWPARAGPGAWLPVAFITYFAGVHTVMHALSRYNMVAMPMLCGAAAVGVFWVLGDKSSDRICRARRAVAGIILAFLGLSYLRPTFWLLIPGISAVVAVYLFWASGLTLIVAGVWWLWRIANDRSRPTFVAATAGGMVLGCLYLGQALPREGYSEWSLRLDHPGKVAQRIITLPDWVLPDSVQGAYLLLDAQTEQGRSCEITLDVDHIHSVFAADKLTDLNEFYSKPNYMTFMQLDGDRPCDVRGWQRSSINRPLLDTIIGDHQITITLSATPKPPDAGGVILYGDLPVPNYVQWQGPGFDYSAVERYHEGADPRIWATTPLEFESSQSTLIRYPGGPTDDLSDDFGRQVGQYRMLIVLLMSDGRWRYF